MSRASIGSDVQYLREQAKESIKDYAIDHLPEQYQVCLVALDSIIKRAFDILEKSDDKPDDKAAGNGVIQGCAFGKAGIAVQCHYNR